MKKTLIAIGVIAILAIVAVLFFDKSTTAPRYSDGLIKNDTPPATLIADK